MNSFSRTICFFLIPFTLFGWNPFSSSHPFALSHIPAIPPSYVLANTYGSSTTTPCTRRTKEKKDI